MVEDVTCFNIVSLFINNIDNNNLKCKTYVIFNQHLNYNSFSLFQFYNIAFGTSGTLSLNTNNNNFVSKMGACAGCMGPSRRDENYRVNRLTENAPIKNRVSSSELPVNKYRERVVTQLQEQRRRIDSRQDLRLDPNNLISTLRQSPDFSASPYKQPQKLSSSTILYKDRDPNESMFVRQSFNNQSAFMGKTIKKSESGMVDENSGGIYNTFGYQRISSDRKYTIQGRAPLVSQFRASSHGTESGKIPLSQVGLNKSMEFGSYTKRKELLNIPELPQQQSRTPHYVRQMRKQNGEDVLRTGLGGVPKKLQTAPSANLFRYLKDLQ